MQPSYRLTVMGAPGFYAFPPRFDFLHLPAGQREEERRVEIGPARVAAEVGVMQCVPRGFERVSGESGARVETPDAGG